MEYYDTIASGYDELHKAEQLNKYRLIREHLNIGCDEGLLDVGCGTGLFSQVFKCRITGIDPSREMLREMKKKVHGNGDYVQGEAEHLPFEDDVFDVVLCVSAIHNFKRPISALGEIKRVCKGRGAVTILKKAKSAEDLRTMLNDTVSIDKIIEEEKDSLLFFRVG